MVESKRESKRSQPISQRSSRSQKSLNSLQDKLQPEDQDEEVKVAQDATADDVQQEGEEEEEENSDDKDYDDVDDYGDEKDFNNSDMPQPQDAGGMPSGRIAARRKKIKKPRRKPKESSMPVKLLISGRNLKDLDTFSKSDPYCIVFEQIRNESSAEEAPFFRTGRTEVIQDDLNPDFQKAVDIDFYFEKDQMLKFDFADDDGGDSDNPVYESIGYAQVKLAEIMSSVGQTVTRELIVGKNGETCGIIIIRAEAVKESNHLVSFRAYGKKLKLSTGNCVAIISYLSYRVKLEILRKNPGLDDTYQQVFISEDREGRNPKYKKTRIQLQQLCNSDMERPLKFQILNNDKPISFGLTTVNELKHKHEIDLQMIKDGSYGGIVWLENYFVTENPNFSDYLSAGWQMSLSIAVDFTASNLAIFDPRSLHFPYKDENAYEKAIREVGTILESYDHFKNFPFFGFGGMPKFMGGSEVSHCFPMNGNIQSPEVAGIRGMLATYKKNLAGIRFAGPTFFCEILEVFMEFVEQGLALQTYFVLLILTDGEIHDMKETKRLIVELSKMPCSIIVLGVGNEDFEMMEELDSDEKLLKDDKKRFAKRDIVQFVKYKEAIARGNLAEQVLKEIPGQVCRYMEMIGYVPEAVPANLDEMEKSIKKQKSQMMKKKKRSPQRGRESSAGDVSERSYTISPKSRGRTLGRTAGNSLVTEEYDDY